MNSMFIALGVLSVDHYSVTTRDLITTLKDYLSIPNSKLLRGPGQSLALQADYAFVELGGMGVIEILSPLNEGSPISTHLNVGGGAYHLCYSVDNLNQAVTIAERDFGAEVVLAAQVTGIFNERKTAILKHPLHGLFELLESYPSSIVIESKIVKNTIQAEQIMSIYCSVVNEGSLDIEQFMEITMDNCSEWDSFKHLLLMMEIEKQFEISISANDMSKLDSLDKIDTYLAQK